MFCEIKSPDNPIFKLLKKLADSRQRAKTGMFMAEGEKEVLEAAGSGFRIEYLISSESYLTRAEELFGKDTRAERFLTFPDKLFKTVSDTVTAQGIMCVCRVAAAAADIRADGIYIYCDRVTDPGNLGTIIRTADAAKIDGVVLSAGCVDPYIPKVVRASMGSVFHIPVFHAADGIHAFKGKGYSVVAGALENSIPLYEAELSRPLLLVVGNESGGVCDEVLAAADKLVKIPIPGEAESLNVSVAAAILMYETVRRKI